MCSALVEEERSSGRVFKQGLVCQERWWPSDDVEVRLTPQPDSQSCSRPVNLIVLKLEIYFSKFSTIAMASVALLALVCMMSLVSADWNAPAFCHGVSEECQEKA